MKRIIPLLLIAATTGCTYKTTQMYNPQYGYAEDNKQIFSNDKTKCTTDAYKKYPIKQPPKFVEHTPNTRTGSLGGAIARANRDAQIDEMNELSLNQYKEYNNSRTDFINTCLQNKGWTNIEIEKEY